MLNDIGVEVCHRLSSVIIKPPRQTEHFDNNTDARVFIDTSTVTVILALYITSSRRGEALLFTEG